jgi:hypothetical protein
MLKFKNLILQINTVLLLLLVIGTGCIKEEDFQYDKIAASIWDPNVAFPLINSSLGIQDLTGFSNSTTIEVDSTDLVHLIYKANVYSVYGYQFLPILGQSNNQTFSLSSADSTALYQTGTVSFSVPVVFPFVVANGEQLDSILLRTGTIALGIQSQIPHGGSLGISIPDATLNGIPFSRNLPFTYSGSTPLIASSSDGLSGYKFNLAGNGSFNQLRVVFTITFNNSSSTQACTNRNFYLNMDLNNLQMAEAYGYFGQRSLTVTGDTSKIELFNNTLFGNISFRDPHITFNLSNSFGVPVDAQMTSIYSISATGVNTPITGSIPDPLPIGTPANIGEIATGSFFIDKTNSNINSIMDNNPKYIAFNVDAISNSPVPSYNFLTDSSLFAVDVEVNLPLRGSANGFSVSDTTDFELENITELQKAIFRINAQNGFPADAYVQVYFTDSNNVILDSLISNPSDFIIASGLLNSDGRVILPNRKSRDEEFSKQRLKGIYDAKKIIIFSVVNTQNAPTLQVPIYSSYKLDIKIGVHAFLNIEF